MKRGICWGDLIIWTVANAAAIATLSYLLSGVVGIYLTWIFIGSVAWQGFAIILVGTICGILAGSVAAFGQYLALFRRVAWRRQWVVATITGWAVGGSIGWLIGWTWLAGRIIYDIAEFTYFGWIAVALAIGISQCLVLRRHGARAGLWVVTTIMGWGLGVIAFSGVSAYILLIPPGDSYASNPWLTWILIGCVAGVVTGVTMLKLVRQ